MAGTLVLFWAFAGLALASALGCITRRSPVASALWLVVTLFALAALFVLLDAQFIAVLQLLVYAGAIMVLFLFVIMLLNLGHPGPMDVKRSEEHTSELQSQFHLVCRLLLEKKNAGLESAASYRNTSSMSPECAR